MYSFLLNLTLILFTSHFLFAQENPKWRKELHDIRAFADGSLPDIWAEFDQVNQRRLTTGRAAPDPAWRSMGPNTLTGTAGRMTCHSFNPQNPKSIYAGSATGGLWRTRNLAQNWELVTDNLPSTRVSAVNINPIDSNHILIGTGQYMGTSFTLQPGIGLLESRDNGLTWTLNNLNFPASSQVSVSRILWDPNDIKRIYVGTSNGVYVSLDTGNTWSLELAGTITDMEIIYKSSETLLASVFGIGIFKSADFGQTWNQITNGLPQFGPIGRINFDVCDSIPGFLLASFIDINTNNLLGFYKSIDTGNSWKLQPTPPDFLCTGGCLGWFVNLVAISPLDTLTYFLGGIKMQFTADGGINYSQVDYLKTPVGGNKTGLTYVDQWDLGFYPNSDDTVFSFNDGGVFVSTNGGGFWNPSNTDLETAQVYRIASFKNDSVYMIAGLQDNGSHYLDNSNGNTHWTRWAIGDGCSHNYDPVNPARVYGENLFGTHYRNFNVTVGFFQTFNIMNGIIGPNTVAFHFVTTADQMVSQLLYTADDQRIYKTTNAGALWNEIALIPSVRSFEIHPTNNSRLIASSYTNTTWSLNMSEDGGNTWNLKSSPGWRVTDIEAVPHSPGTIYATRNSAFSGNPHVFKSTDNGNSWFSVSSGLPDVSTNTIAINDFDTNIVYVGTDLGVFISEDGGTTWSDYYGNISPFIVMDMHFHKYDSTLRIGTLGRGVWKTKSFLGNTVGIKELEESAKLLVSPNPFNGEILMSWDSDRSALKSVRVLNSNGQRIRTLNVPRGSNRLLWKGVNQHNQAVPSGIYFLELAFSEGRLVRKIVKE